jgi:hypothetical protein
MQRRQFNQSVCAVLAGLVAAAHEQARALTLGALSEKDASQGLKVALEKGALAAVGLLGKTDGFLGNPQVRIPLPGFLKEAASLFKLAGQGKRLDELVTSMNRAAETAVPMGKDLLVHAVKSMSVSDAKGILTGGERSVTAFFEKQTRAALGERFLPVVNTATEKVGLAQTYNRVAAQAAGMGLVKPADATVQQYVTGKTLDALYTVIGEEERKIRQDPVGTGSALLQKVFGSIR